MTITITPATTRHATTRARRRCGLAATPPSSASTAAAARPAKAGLAGRAGGWARGSVSRTKPSRRAVQRRVPKPLEQLGPAPAVYYAIVVIVAAFVMLGLGDGALGDVRQRGRRDREPVRDLHPPARVGRLRAGRHGHRDVDPVPAVALARDHRRDPRRRGDDAAVRAGRRSDDQRRQLVGAVRLVRLPAVRDPQARGGGVPRRLLRAPPRPAARTALRHRAADAGGDGVLRRQLHAGRPRFGDRARRRRAGGRRHRRHPARARVGCGVDGIGRRRARRSCPTRAASTA